MTKTEAIEEINRTQDFYIDQLISIIEERSVFDLTKEISFTSPTGTGKTIMMAKLMNHLEDSFFVITTLSRGQLKNQIDLKLNESSKYGNFIVFGLNDFTSNTKKQKTDFERMLPKEKRLIWIRDEGHIATNRWQEILREKAFLVIDFSATNKINNGIQCNFTHTMMLRTVKQEQGTVDDALNKLIEVKRQHRMVSDYNPCALLRIIDDSKLDHVYAKCQELGLSYINITDENYDMSDICRDDNNYDVIINKLKVTEGIDLKRCHVIYLDSKPKNASTIIQVIGRSRRNALLWRDDLDIFDTLNEDILRATKFSYVYFEDADAIVAQNENGEFVQALCDQVSVEDLKERSLINVVDGVMDNGLKVTELIGQTGKFLIEKDPSTGFLFVDNPYFYEKRVEESKEYCLDLSPFSYNINKIYFKPTIKTVFSQEKKVFESKYSYLRLRYFAIERCGVEEDDLEKIDSLSDAVGYFEAKYELKNMLVRRFGGQNSFDRIYGEFCLPEDEKNRIREMSTAQGSPKGISLFSLDFVGGYLYCYINSALYKHIEKIELKNLELKEEVQRDILKYKNIKQLSFNSYFVSRYPTIEYLNSKGINTKDELRKFIKKSKTELVFGISKLIWFETLIEIKKFTDLDQKEGKQMNLVEVCSFLKLPHKKETLQLLINGNYPIKEIYAPYSNLIIKRANDKNGDIIKVVSQGPTIYQSDITPLYKTYKKTVNDREIALISGDTFRYQKSGFIEDESVTSKITKYSKFNKYIKDKYWDILNASKTHYYRFENDMGIPSKEMSCLGFCVEYYAKIRLLGEKFYEAELEEAKLYFLNQGTREQVIVRAAYSIYKYEMMATYGKYVSKYIKVPRTKDDFGCETPFVKLVAKLGERVVMFLNKLCGISEVNATEIIRDPNLSVEHIKALADFVTRDSIIDIKCTSSINEQYVKQVCSYHFLSTKRDDLDIKRLYIFDACRNRYFSIDLDSSTCRSASI